MRPQPKASSGALADICDHASVLIRGASGDQPIASAKRAAGVLDFADMIVDAERLLRTRPEVLDAVLAEIDCVIVDEFQDTNPVQFALLWRLAQPLTRQIQLLERDIGVELFDRSGRAIRLTEAGRRFLPEARTRRRAATGAATPAYRYRNHSRTCGPGYPAWTPTTPL
ncbi:hypothetical protein DPM13_09650 [Paracoccus mutanolyticus]|uniref:DNA 3'-5' helicase II n=1 Tax=Paracoccus mutanolyticus TaxID=1499308 RepID=A0ABN5M8X6_9RHOB|nr:UvrD-helicase domain-containing protein [Paracoccus mutanolyticus]AWX93280.1 hypothetical protein DPM13_09650 [Paracoccus mutanolyticus]